MLFRRTWVTEHKNLIFRMPMKLIFLLTIIYMTGSYVFHFESCRNHSYYVLDSTINVTESHHHEFKTGGGSYPITILPEVKLKTNN